jgi:predicted metalloprotease
MRLKRLRRRRGGVIDRRGGFGRGLRGAGVPVSLGGGLSIGAIVIIALILGAMWLFGGGGSLGDVLDDFEGAGPASGEGGAQVDPDDRMGEFVDAVVDDVQVTWTNMFRRAGLEYELTSVVLFEGQTSSGCGAASSSTGPFYCPADRRIYLDTDFFRVLEQRFGAPGDFAQAYVIAHEVGHHVQNLLGTEAEVRREMRENRDIANELSVRLELQADCFAGVWGRAAQSQGILQPGDIEDGLRAASAIGDDRILGRRADRDSFTHGTAEQRSTWLRTGIQIGNPDACDTFSIPYSEL